MGRFQDPTPQVRPIGEPPFTIRVARSGGFAGIKREWSIEVTESEQAQRWVRLIEACPWTDAGGDPHPDGFIYAFHAADLEAVVPEQRLDGPWRTLADEVQRASDL